MALVLPTLIGILQDGIPPVPPSIQPRTMSRASTGTISIQCYHVNGNRLNLTGGAVVWTVDDGAGNIFFSRAGDFVDAANGVAAFSFVAADTVNAVSRANSNVHGRHPVVFIDNA